MIIAKNEQMKKVLGLGYPSAPIYTVEEFGEKQMQMLQQQAMVNCSKIRAIFLLGACLFGNYIFFRFFPMKSFLNEPLTEVWLKYDITSGPFPD